MSASPTVLLTDADVLIDYRESGLSVLKLIAQHVGRLVVLPSVLDEVSGVTVTECARLGIEIVKVETNRTLRAAEVESNVSFNDRLCLLVCREEGWTCVTNDGALRRLCGHHGVETRHGLGLMVDLVSAGVLIRRRAMSVARRMQTANPLHINDWVLTRFVNALDRVR